MKSLLTTTFWTGFSTLIKILIGLLAIKLLATSFGVEGIGQAANYMTLLTVLSVFCGAGIFNGITKYVAEFELDKKKLAAVLGTSSTIILCFSLLLAVVFYYFAATISTLIFGSTDYQLVIKLTAFCQFGMAFSNFLLAILKGLREAKKNAQSVIIGTILGIIIFILLSYFFAYQGALIGLAIMPAMMWIPACWLLKKYHQQPLSAFDFSLLKFYWQKEQASALFKFSAMVLATAITLPISYIVIRNWLTQHYSIDAVGLWQAMSRISDAYLQFITAAFSVYLLPTLAKLKTKQAIGNEIVKTLMIIFPLIVIASAIIYLFRFPIINILFTRDFLAMESLFVWQLTGDIFKVCAYIFGYLVIAKASLRFYVLAEVTQSILLLASAYYLIPKFGVQGAVQSYMITYIAYFLLCSIIFYFYVHKKNHYNAEDNIN